MTSSRRELTTTLPMARAWAVVTDLTGPGHWGRAVRTFAPVDGRVEDVGAELVSTTWVFDEPLESDVVVVRHERSASRCRLVLRNQSPVGGATETLHVLDAGDRGTVVEHLMVVDSTVDDAAMTQWLGIFADLCRDGIRDALEASGS
ncbi:hypothetical protein [Solicola sp. PLA-1-18]|uniref:hypothetical protein n=1 Tax=Solicola sp. PLA-1-18 TaxID=3380532 RepID=UPI003B7BDC50